MKSCLVYLLCGAPFFFVGCYDGDDQTIVKEQNQNFANPEPVERSFEAINQAHKILIGVIDTGVDYNHPYLKKNIHFLLDEDKSPIGQGLDPLAGDAFAHPNLVRTSLQDPDLSEEDRVDATLRSANVAKILSINSALSYFLHSARNFEQELITSTYHGTHVAGLTSYDAPEIGILSYRVLPYNRTHPDGSNRMKNFTKRVLASVTAAAEQGVRIINLSLGVTFRSSDYSAVEFSEAFDEIANRYPHILFLAAAGNGGTWIDGVTRMQAPCGVDAKNVLCVGALNADMTLANFSNIIVKDIPVV